ncbi:MAG: erythromycin esterase family protein [Deltaproteobacteria bacterium]|nr:erythromycin esterase family protein [Deltaproteobacteria bacterium]
MTRSIAPLRALGSLLTIALCLACHRAPERSTTTQPPAAAAGATGPLSNLDLGFEHPQGPRGWKTHHTHYAVALDDAVAFEGDQSLRLSHDGIHKAGRVSLPVPIDAVRGQTLHATVRARTQGVTRGGVGLQLHTRRGDDMLGWLQTPLASQKRGDEEWSTLTLAIDIPTDADEVTLVLDHAGNGVAWFDGVELSLEDTVAGRVGGTVLGRILDTSGEPVAGATVAILADGPPASTQTDTQGRYELRAPAGTYTMGATAPQGVADQAGVVLDSEHATQVDLTLAVGTQQLSGIVRDQHGAAFPGALAIVATADQRLYPTRTDAEGTWTVRIPPAEQYMAVVTNEQAPPEVSMVADPDALVETLLPRPQSAPPEAVAWVQQHHVPLSSVEPGAPMDDLAALDSMVAGKTVIGLGEATHGTREFFRFKHRMLEYLVERHGFTVFAIEANRPECRAINRYIQTGEGDPRRALEGIYFWTWNTHEVLDQIEWMRRYNQTHDHPLQFVGVDAQISDVAARNVVAFLERVDPDAPGRDAVALLGQPWNWEAYQELPDDGRAAIDRGLEQLTAQFERQREAWSAATSADEWADASEDLTVVRQVMRVQRAPGMESFAARDRAMADNVLHVAKRYGKGTKTVLWAHNGHVARTWSMSDTMGHYLGQALGDRYLALGFAFDHGGFQAIGMRAGTGTGLREHQVGPAPHGSFDAALRDGGPPLFALSLRDAPRQGPVAAWLRKPLPTRHVGAGFDAADEAAGQIVEVMPDRYDAVVFVEQTTRARPIRRQR